MGQLSEPTSGVGEGERSTAALLTIIGCRWQPQSGSIQLPVTFIFDEHSLGYRKKKVVCARGPHINRLREALEARMRPQAEPDLDEVEAVGSF